MNFKRYILDGVISGEELLWIYHRLLETPLWSLSRTSIPSTGPGRNIIPFMGFPGLNIESRGEVCDEFLSGYFRSLIFRVKYQLKKDYSAQLPSKVKRIHVGGKSSFSRTEFHSDSEDENDWTILGFLNPVWNDKDGGEFYLDKEKIEYKAGRFVVFPSHVRHDGGYVVNESLSYWRVAANIILTKPEKIK